MNSNADCDFEDGRPVPSVDFNYDAIDGYDFSERAEAEALLEAFKRAFDWISNVSPNDFKGMAIRVQVIRCVLLKRDQREMADEIGVTKAAISQRMCDLRDYFKMRQPKSGLRDNETRQQFSEQCKQRHQQKKKQASSDSPNSPTTSTANTETATASPSMPLRAARPLSKQLYEQALS